jgi:histidine ammonia-lyase
MLSQYTADHLIVEQRMLSAPPAIPCRSRRSGSRAPARRTIRRHVAHLDIDRPLFNDHNAMKALVQSGEILEAVEREVGALG